MVKVFWLYARLCLYCCSQFQSDISNNHKNVPDALSLMVTMNHVTPVKLPDAIHDQVPPYFNGIYFGKRILISPPKSAKIRYSPFSLHPPQNKWPQFVRKKLLPWEGRA